MPIPEDFKIASGEKKEFDLLPEDTYQVEISKIELRKDQPVYNSDEVEDKFSFEFTVVEEGMYKGRKQWLDVRPIMSAGFEGGSPSWLYKLFCAVNQVQLNDDEARGISTKTINDMEGQQLRLVIKQKKNQKGVLKNKIGDVLPTKGQPIGQETIARPRLPDSIQIDDGDIPF